VAPAILLVLKFNIAALIFGFGAGATSSQVTYLWRHPALFLRSLLAMYVLVPALAIGLVALLPLSEGTELALIVLAVSAGAPLLPRKLIGRGNDDYILSLLVNTSLLAVVAAPAWLALIRVFLPAEEGLLPLEVARELAIGFALPLLAGMAVRRILGDRADTTSDAFVTYGSVLLLVCGGLLLFTNLALLYQIPFRSYFAVIGLMAGALAIGHVCGGPGALERTTLGVSCATRHLGVAIVIATTAPTQQAATIVVGYVICSAAVTIPYLNWRLAGAELSGDAGG